jgi:hypothetical protein
MSCKGREWENIKEIIRVKRNLLVCGRSSGVWVLLCSAQRRNIVGCVVSPANYGSTSIDKLLCCCCSRNGYPHRHGNASIYPVSEFFITAQKCNRLYDVIKTTCLECLLDKREHVAQAAADWELVEDNRMP